MERMKSCTVSTCDVHFSKRDMIDGFNISTMCERFFNYIGCSFRFAMILQRETFFRKRTLSSARGLLFVMTFSLSNVGFGRVSANVA
jgi:hypothetical protein